MKANIARTLAALSATNEAILYAKSPEELYRKVCEAAFLSGDFLATAVFLLEQETGLLRFAVGFGEDILRLRGIDISSIAGTPEGSGVCGQAFRDQALCISNDFLTDARSLAWRKGAAKARVGAAAALPLICGGRSVGVLIVTRRKAGSLTAQIISMLQRMSANIGFALDNFDLAEEKSRLARMFAALSATNEAIIRAKSRTEMFELVCEAAAVGGKFTSVKIGLVRPNAEFLEIVAAAGPDRAGAMKVKISADAGRPEGRGITGTALRTAAPCIANDYLAVGAAAHFHQAVKASGTRSGATLPLLKDGKAIGGLIFLSSELDAFSPELIGLLRRLADNVSFALENFDKADAKTKADERVEYLASHDSLTRLPNREMFNALLRHAIESGQRYQRRFAVLFIDLDRFKVINDTLGHQAGDILLLEVAQRLRRSLRASDVVARLGGDEFVVILGEADDGPDVERIARALLSELSEPLQLSGHEWQTTASIGIALYPKDGLDVETLTKNADMAMYLAKEEGRNGFRFFTRETRTQSIEALQLEAALRRALERGQLSLQYQPKVDMAGERITGVEALLRWTHPDFGAVSPVQFIPLAEEIGLIVPIGRWVLREACAQAMRWQRPLSMAVNLSPRQFADERLLEDIDEALAASGLAAAQLQLEVTESMVMHNVSRAMKVLDAIRSRGVRLAMDDFGTGYSSMSLMKQLPIDTIKIDRSFVRDLPADSEDCAIVRAIISMGRALQLAIIAEGVETAEQEAFLRDNGCDEMQGFLFSRPLWPKQLARLLRSAPLLASPPLQPGPGGAAEVRSLRPGRIGVRK